MEGEPAAWDVGDGFDLAWGGRRLARLGMRLGAERRERILTTYYDTPDLRLLAAGITVGHRRGGATTWTLEVPTASGAYRLILDDPAGPGSAVLHGPVPGELARKVTGWVAGAELVPQLTVDTSRVVTQVVAAAGKPVLELAD